MKTVIYARVSSQEQADNKFSIETQIEDCQNHARRQEDVVVKTYVDIQSGRDAQKGRLQFEQMLKDAKAGLFEKIIVWRPDRLFRGLTPAAKLAKVLDETDVDIEGVLQPLTRRTVGLWAWVAEQDVESMTDRLVSGKRANAREIGKWGGGFVKYGYRYNCDKTSPDYTGKLEIDEAEAGVVLGLFQWVDEGKTASSWCRWANEQAIPTKRRSQGWTPQEVSEMLRNRCYTGSGAYGKLTRRGNRLVPANNPVSLSYPRIIDDDLFERVQQRLLENKRGNRGSTRSDRTYILQHMGQCGVCGGRLCCTTNGMGYRYMYCLNQRRFPHIYRCYKPQNWQLDLIEDYIWDEVNGVLSGYVNGSYEALIERLDNGRDDRQKAISKISVELEHFPVEKQRILTILRKGYINEAEAEIQLTVINSEEAHLQQELAQAEHLQANSVEVWQAFKAQLHELDRFRFFGFHHISADQKKQLLLTLLQGFVLFKDGKLEIRFKLPVKEQVADTILTLSSNDTIFGNNNYEAIRTIDISIANVP
ncbi:MAG TPA: recombinase family protein [Dehalococcoidia bacterium]|nr:recombinase family protein [Dehalococcoidia bacterium]